MRIYFLFIMYRILVALFILSDFYRFQFIMGFFNTPGMRFALPLNYHRLLRFYFSGPNVDDKSRRRKKVTDW